MPAVHTEALAGHARNVDRSQLQLELRETWYWLVSSK